MSLPLFSSRDYRDRICASAANRACFHRGPDTRYPFSPAGASRTRTGRFEPLKMVFEDCLELPIQLLDFELFRHFCRFLSLLGSAPPAPIKLLKPQLGFGQGGLILVI